MNSLTEKNALLTYTKDTMHVQSTTNNYPTSEGSATPNSKNLEKVWSPNKFNQKKPELITLALDNPLKISWGCLKQPSTPMDGNKTKTKQHTSSSMIHSPPSPTSSTSSSSTCSDTDQPIALRHTSPPIHHNISNANDNSAANDDAISPGGGGPLSPMHHARRPMNAFLIFCKKHRPVVRRKFLTLENRAVTKILGEWWALLEVEEKEAYTTLAKEYKDAFFNANPNFKWYKLPAPPLRTLHTRPTTNLLLQQQLSPNNNSNSTTATLSTTMAGILNSYNTITGCTSITLTCTDKEKGFMPCPLGGAAAASHKESNGGGRVEFTPGKLADESQLGKLSSLLNMSNNNIHMENSNYYSHNNNNYNTENNNNNNTTYTSINDTSAVNTPVTKQFDSHTPIKPIKKREIVTNNNQNDSLSRMFDSFDGSSNRIFDTSIRLSDNPFRANDICTGSRSSVDGSQVARNLFDDEEAECSEERKVGRKCKGQRYKEFMINGKLLKNKRDKLFEDDGDEFLQLDSNSQDNSCMRPHHIDLDTTIKMLAERTRTKLPESPHKSGNTAPSDYIGSLIQGNVASANAPSNNENTNNGNNTFNLDDKIAMLPCLSYEQYVRRKRDSKKRSKFVRNRSQSAIEITGKSMEKSTIATMAPVASVAGLVGSKKRKNKQNITHLKGKNVKEFMAKENAKDVKEDNFVEKGKEVNVAPDLFGLATLAEIAANTEKLNQ